MAAEINFTSSTVTLEHMDDVMPLIRECLDNGQSIRFSPRGISMLPMLRQGRDTVTLSPITNDLKKYDVALYVRTNGKCVLHRIVKTGETYTCSGDNQVIYERGLLQEQFVGIVTAFSRDGKEYSVCDAGYKLYCRIWHHSRYFRRVLRAIKRRIKKLFSL